MSPSDHFPDVELANGCYLCEVCPWWLANKGCCLARFLAQYPGSGGGYLKRLVPLPENDIQE